MLSGRDVFYQTAYPTVPNRYSILWWNRNYQFCYTPEDLAYLKKIRTAYEKLISRELSPLYYDVQEVFAWREWWSCKYPIYFEKHPLDYDGFTLPIRSAKDDKLYPLDKLSREEAALIANWQSARVKNQNLQLMNDPTMLALEELKNWYLNDISSVECKHENIEPIIKRQSYIKQLIHLIPYYGLESIRFHELEKNLDHSIQILTTCIMQKELPQFLTSLIVNAKNYEMIMGTYLHFLNVNQEVSDNYAAPGFALSDIKMSSYATEVDHKNYHELNNMLDLLTQVRSAIEDFREILPKVGTYLFSLNYVKEFEKLAHYYSGLIEKSQAIMHQLIGSTNDAFYKVLKENTLIENKIFIKNYKALEISIAKDTTMKNQLDFHVGSLKKSISAYHSEMHHLVNQIDNGNAVEEVSMLGNSLLNKMVDLNKVLPQTLGLPASYHPLIHYQPPQLLESEPLHTSTATRVEPWVTTSQINMCLTTALVITTFKSIFPLTLPWNRTKDMTTDDKALFAGFQLTLTNYKTRYLSLVNSIIDKMKVLEDQFAYIKKSIKSLEKKINKCIIAENYSNPIKNEMINKFERIEDHLTNIEKQNQSAKIIFKKIKQDMEKKSRNLLSLNTQSFFKIRYQVVTRELVCEKVEKGL